VRPLRQGAGRKEQECVMIPKQSLLEQLRGHALKIQGDQYNCDWCRGAFFIPSAEVRYGVTTCLNAPACENGSIFRVCSFCGADEKTRVHRSAPCCKNAVKHRPNLWVGWEGQNTHPPASLEAPTDAADKQDAGKPSMELLPAEAMTEVAKVLEYGARKYAPNNWRKGLSWGRLSGAALRHLFAWIGGEDNDKETRLSHLAHAACCVLFLLASQKSGHGTDDRWKP
jgi:hypothetical protein